MIELLHQHTADSLVATGSTRFTNDGPTQQGDRTKSDLLADAANVATALPRLLPNEQILLVFRQDRYAFACALLACWSRGYAVCLPPNQRGETISQLLSSARVGALLHDTAVSGHLSVPELLSRPSLAAPLSGVSLPPSTIASVMTSGSTGQSAVWDKTAIQLLGEVAELARTFSLGPGLNYAVTVPPTHLYGLLFGVLLPLHTGSSFCRHTPLLPGELSASVAHNRAQVLVSVPTHLRAARTAAVGSLDSLRVVFSSAGPLPEETAQQFTQRHNQSITEIFGSTETGGIAWRRRDQFSAWTPFTGVHLEVTADEQLRVTSPFTSTLPRGSIGWSANTYVTADRVQLLDDGCFHHLGRQDGVVKVGGQRVSLPAMEECLLKCPGIEDVAILAVPEQARGHRLLAAVVGVSSADAACRDHLQAHFEPSTLPRKFLFLDKLPRESNGKLMRSRLLRLFGLDDIGHPMSKDLVFHTWRSEDTGDATARDFSSSAPYLSVTERVQIPANHIAFSGHFENYPVLAGAVQVQHIVLPAIQKHRPSWTSPTGLRRVKFTGRIEPGDTIDVHLELRNSECSFTLSKADKACSAGTLTFSSELNPT